MTSLLFWLFFLSGAAGLMYESIWARYLGLFVGHDAYGQILVLVIFLGGMSLGAAAVSGLTGRLRSPLLAYALVELAVGALGFSFHHIYLAVTERAYLEIYPALVGTWKLSAVKWGLAGGLILPQSVLLGATFPLMSAGVLRLTGRPPGQILALLYFTNSLGAALGVLVAGFYLLAWGGLPGTLTAAATLNVVVALATLIVVAVTRTRPAPAARGDGPAPESLAGPGPSPPLPRLRSLLLAVSFGTAVASFIYEIAWIRLLSLVLGSATHSFELMLSAFILGLALGAWFIRSRADRFGQPLRALGIIQWLMGFCALATLPLYAESFEWMSRLMATFARSDGGYLGLTVARYGICLAVMLPATFLAGMTLPLLTRTLMVSGEGERAVGMVYAVNTLGSITGVVLAALVLLPWIGLKSMLLAGAVIDMGLGVALLVSATRPARRLTYGLAAATGLVAIVGWSGVRLDKGRLVSGVFRTGALRNYPASSLAFYRDGRTATVSVLRAPGAVMTYLATNGKPDASLGQSWLIPCQRIQRREPLSGDPATQTLSALIALAHAPGARTAAIIGHGSGMSSHLLLASPSLTDLETIEIEPEMIEGSRVFYPANRRVFEDRRSHLVIDDAKSFFAAQGRTFDLILSEPSNPWVSGVSGLFTTEFYGRIRRYLTEDGIFAQWLHLYELNDELVLRVLAAVHRNFPSYEIFLTTNSDILIVAGASQRLPDPDWSIFSLPEVEKDLCRFVPLTPASLEATRLMGRSVMAPLLDSLVVPNSDFHPALDLGAEKQRFYGAFARGFQGLASERFSIAGLLQGRKVPPSDDPSLPVDMIPRLRAASVGAQVRSDRAGTRPDRSQALDATGQILRWRMWRAYLAADSAPNNWPAWLQLMVETERNLSAGAIGTADAEFYRSVQRYLDRHAAPPPIRSAVAFYHGLAATDFAEAAVAAEQLLPHVQRGLGLMTPEELLDGAVVAALKVHNPAGARRFFNLIIPYSDRPRSDVRARLLEAHLRAAESPP